MRHGEAANRRRLDWTSCLVAPTKVSTVIHLISYPFEPHLPDVHLSPGVSQ